MLTCRAVAAVLAFGVVVCITACSETPPVAADANTPSKAAPPADNVPDWIADAVFYQIFPERFRNGDPSNDPTHASLEFPDVIPADSWKVSPWTGDWYARANWERALGERFYDDGVFHRRYGGDLQGVVDKLDYLHDLGINTIYFNPVFWARSLHKYDGNTFHHVEVHFGPDPEGDLALMATETSDPATWKWTAADKLFLELIEKAHARGIRVIMDGVFNHTGRDFFAFDDLRKKQKQSAYVDWYTVTKWDDPTTEENEFRYKCWWGVDTLPEFADTADGKDLHPGPKKYVFDSTVRWMDPNGDGDPSDGIDGWRLDVANEVPIAFWTQWNAYVRSLYPDAYTVTELWDKASDFLATGGFSATMNYHGFAYPVKGFLIDGELKPSEFATQVETRRQAYPARMQYALQNLIDGHDTDRLASMIVNAKRQEYANRERFDFDVGHRASPRHTDKYDVRKPNERERRIQRLVALFQMTWVGAPMVYYGTEAGMWGGDDPDDRMPMVWPDLVYDDQKADPLGRPREPDTVKFDRDLFEYYRGAIALRRKHAALRRGGVQILSRDDDAGTLVFARFAAGDVSDLVVAINRSDDARTVEIPAIGRPFGALALAEPIFVSSGDVDALAVPPTATKVQVPALTGAVFAIRFRNP